MTCIWSWNLVTKLSCLDVWRLFIILGSWSVEGKYLHQWIKFQHGEFLHLKAVSPVCNRTGPAGSKVIESHVMGCWSLADESSPCCIPHTKLLSSSQLHHYTIWKSCYKGTKSKKKVRVSFSYRPFLSKSCVNIYPLVKFDSAILWMLFIRNPLWYIYKHIHIYIYGVF